MRARTIATLIAGSALLFAAALGAQPTGGAPKHDPARSKPATRTATGKDKDPKQPKVSEPNVARGATPKAAQRARYATPLPAVDAVQQPADYAALRQRYLALVQAKERAITTLLAQPARAARVLSAGARLVLAQERAAVLYDARIARAYEEQHRALLMWLHGSPAPAAVPVDAPIAALQR